MRTVFDNQIAALNQELIAMGSQCEKVLSLAAKALTTGDKELAKTVIPAGKEIDHMERDIERLCLKLLLTQQPIAADLRFISAALKMITDMERIGDQAEDIAEIISFLNGTSCPEDSIVLSMAQAVIQMVTESVDAFVNRDLDLAQKTIDHDDVVDNYFTQAKKALIALVAKQPDNGEYALDLLMIAKYFERIGDHATNIAEWVVFSVTGTHPNAKE